MDRYSWLSTQFEPAIGMVKRGDGPYVLYTDHLDALAKKDWEITALKGEIEYLKNRLTISQDDRLALLKQIKEDSYE